MRRHLLGGALIALGSLLPLPAVADEPDEPARNGAPHKSVDIGKRRKDLTEELAKAKDDRAKAVVRRDEAAVRANTYQLPVDKLARETAAAEVAALDTKIPELEASLAELPSE